MKLQPAKIVTQELDRSIELGINFLHEHQLPNGEFCCYYSPDLEMQEWCVPDSVVFPTALIAACLLPLKHVDNVKNIHRSAVSFLRYQMMRGGVWNYYTRWNPFFKYSPADIDDTIFACHVLRSLDLDVPHNEQILLANRNTKGLFFTWFILRPTTLKLDKKQLMVMARELKYPFNSLIFWTKHGGKRSDIDGVVNANVLFYLGLNAATQPVVSYLINIIKENKEETCDKWYHNRFIFYYFLSRNHKLKELDVVKDIVIERIYQEFNNYGRIGTSAFDTSLAVSSLLNFNADLNKVTAAVSYLLTAQTETGHWKRHQFFYSGTSKVVGWGSEEITTGFCLEALANYRTALETHKLTA
jgi:hypothetical protein